MISTDSLPSPSESRLAVRVTPDAFRQIRGRHPWIFEASIVSVSRDGNPGDLAVVFDDQRKFAAIGLYDPGSPIRIRVLHSGKPQVIDAEFWTERLAASCSVRADLIAAPATTAFRVVHGENDGFGGLIIDVYEQTLVIKIYSEAWFAHLADVVDAALVALPAAGIAVGSVIVRFSRHVRGGETYGLTDGQALVGEAPSEPVVFSENGLRFVADVVSGQKTGQFLDQRENRAAIRSLSNKRRVLDVFSCSGGFAVHAAAGGATEVTSVDLSKRSLATAERNLFLQNKFFLFFFPKRKFLYW